MEIKEIVNWIEEQAENFGAKQNGEYNNSYVLRENYSSDAFKSKGAYFGIIEPEEEKSGPFHDFSFTVFPADPTGTEKSWVVCLGVGSNGFKNDYDLATYPGVKRLFSKLISDKGFCKTDFSDIETSLPTSFISDDSIKHLLNTLKMYTKVLPVCEIVEDPFSPQGKKIILGFLAAYARLRDWPSNNTHRKAVEDALKPFQRDNQNDDLSCIKDLIQKRKFVVLQGAPGTGKTKAAKEVARQLEGEVFFTQFHAETSFSDFIYGIRPEIEKEQLTYSGNDGVFLKALKFALDDKNKEKQVVLIIDEINRANLSNVLGPIFYLFEHKMTSSEVSIEVSPGHLINKLPDNFNVIASMNTADRSLAVVDFALRRRFAWYTMTPKHIGKYKKTSSYNTLENIDDVFYREDFDSIAQIFHWYASSDELALQPGQGYFIAESGKEMDDRMRYEIFPLIKEYLQEGLLRNAQEEFNTYFQNRIGISLFE